MDHNRYYGLGFVKIMKTNISYQVFFCSFLFVISTVYILHRRKKIGYDFNNKKFIKGQGAGLCDP